MPASNDPLVPLAPLAIWRWKLHWQILVGIGLGVALGFLSGGPLRPEQLAKLRTRWDVQLYGLVGDLFMQGLKMLVVPLIAASIISAMGSLKQREGFARLGGRTLLYYVFTSTIAILLGLCLVNLIRPGEGALSPEQLRLTEGTQEADTLTLIKERTEGKGTADLLDVIRELIPPNIVKAAAEGRMLGLVVFSLLFGYFVSRLQGESRDALGSFWAACSQVMLDMTHLVMRFAPIGICCLIAKTTSDAVGNDTFLERLSQLIRFASTVGLGLAIHAFVTMPLLLRFVGRVSPWRHYQAMGPALLTAFSTASSAATLPMTLECVEQRAGVSNRVSSFVLPVGATVNMDGTALYECVAVMFLAQVYGVTLGAGEQFLVVALALLTSIGVAAVPAASLVAIVIILDAVNRQTGGQIPHEALAIILVFDRLLDMCRTAVNVLSDSCGAVLVARREGEAGVLAPTPGRRRH
jgi:Na+/H+-dicarboxylate symporter